MHQKDLLAEYSFEILAHFAYRTDLLADGFDQGTVGLLNITHIYP